MKFHFYQQLNQNDCGPTCLQMICKFYGKEISAELIRNKCHNNKIGVTLLALSKTAEYLGFKTIGAKLSFERLKNEVILPCICYWGGNHFIVVYKISKRYVWVADPGNGLIKYLKNEFLEKWSVSLNEDNVSEGIILMLEPSEFFFNIENTPKANTYSFKIILNYILRYKKLVLQIAIGLLIGLVIQLLFPILTQSLVDKGIANGDLDFILIILIAQLALTLGRISADFIRSWLLLHITVRVSIFILGDFFIKLMRLPISYFDSRKTGDILQRIEDNSKIQSFLTGNNINMIFSFFSFFVLSGIIITYSINIFLIFISFSTLSVLWIFLFLKKRKKINIAQFEISSQASSKTIQLIQGMQEIKLSTSEVQKRWEWERIQAKMFKSMMSSLKLYQSQSAGNILINETKNILITYIAAKGVVNGDISFGIMLSMQYIVGQLNGPIDQLIGFIQSAQDAKLSLGRINEIHSIPDEGNDNTNEFISGDITFENINFSYNPLLDKRATLHNISFTMKKNTTTAVVGMSGSGKTTLIKLLLGFYKAQEGTIKMGEVNINTVNLEEWRQNIGIVMQEGYIFSDSILNNVALGEELPDIRRFYNAVDVANLREFIDSLPKGYYTEIGSEGVGISQGQKQRILIARAVYKNPGIILFDEATNSLDGNNEKTIMENLDNFFKEKTVLIVAHRLSTIKNADKIIVLKEGKITEQGEHSTLLELKGDYYTLLKNQLN